MKTFKFLLILFGLLSFLDSLNAQLQNQNTYLLRNLNQHPTSNTYQYSACWGYIASNGREYAILGCFPGTAFVDITDSANIHEVGFVPSTNPSSSYNEWREMKVYSHYAYIVSEVTNSGVQIVDLQYLPDSVHYVTRYVFSGYDHTHSIQQWGPYLYLCGGNATSGGGMTVLDLTVNPESPVHRGSWSNQYVHEVRVRNDTVWAANIFSGYITVINAVNKDNLTTITSWLNSPNPFPHNCDLYPGRTYIFTTDETSNPPGVLKVWNISNLSNVTYVTNWQPTGLSTTIVHNVERFGNYLIIAHYEAGIRIVNVSNPTSPNEVAWYDTYINANSNDYYGCWGVYAFPSGKIIGSDTQTGLYVIKTTFSITGVENQTGVPGKFELRQNYPNPFNPSTNIEYSLPQNSYVTIKVFDVAGKQVGLLADGYEFAGTHKLTYDASRLSSGIYFYTMEAEGFHSTKKFTLLK